MLVGMGEGLFVSLFIDPYIFFLPLVSSLNIELHIWIIKRHFSMEIFDILLLHQYVSIIVNCWRRVLFIFKEPTTRQLCSNESPWPFEDVPDVMYYFLSVDLSNTTWAQRGLINKLPGNEFDAVTRIRPSNITTFGATNVVHKGITFGAGIGVGNRKPKYFYSGTMQYIW